MSAIIGAKIDHVINETERALSFAAALPVVGTVAGLSKVLMGVAQTIVGLVGGIFTLPARCMDNSALNDYFWTHFVHGLGNIAAGAFEAIPLIGSGMYLARLLKEAQNNSMGIYVSTRHEDKFMPYESLMFRDLKIGGLMDDLVPVAQKLFDDRVAQNINPDLTYSEKLTIANDAINDAWDQYRLNKQANRTALRA